MIRKKSQLYGQIFIYILTVLLVSFILIYGYNAIQNFKKRAEQVSCLKFKEDLKNSVMSILSDFSSVKRKDLTICADYNKVCFVETYGFSINPYITVPAGVDPVIEDSIVSGTGKNVFLVDNVAKESFYIGNISVEPDVVRCLTAKNSQISLKLEGKGNHVLLSEWS